MRRTIFFIELRPAKGGRVRENTIFSSLKGGKNSSYKFFRVISIPQKGRAQIKFNSSRYNGSFNGSYDSCEFIVEHLALFFSQITFKCFAAALLERKNYMTERGGCPMRRNQFSFMLKCIFLQPIAFLPLKRKKR
jgi:hypothetical protein